MTAGPSCRACGAPLSTLFVDLGLSPLANVLPQRTAPGPDPAYPLRAYVCDKCLLVQVEDMVPREAHFRADYPYFSSYSDSWLEHARRFAEHAIDRFGFGPGSRVVEVGSNDGYLLRNFVARGIGSLGIDPAQACADAARAHGVETRVDFFGSAVAAEIVADGFAADLVVANNVLAHVPDINDFVAGLARLLRPDGVLAVEFQHLLPLIEKVEYDTIYHEHYSYLSLTSIANIFLNHGLAIFGVEELPTHGGSLRVYAGRAGRHQITQRVDKLDARERAAGLGEPAGYLSFAGRVRAKRAELLETLDGLRRSGARIVGYGAPAKAVTLANYCGLDSDTVAFTVDRNPMKQERRLPGTGIDIRPPESLAEAEPSHVLIFPWNIADEIVRDLRQKRGMACRFIVPGPDTRIL